MPLRWCFPDGRLVTGGEDGRIAIWQRGAPQPEAVLTGHTAPVTALAVSPDGKRLASGSWDRTVRIWPVGGSPGMVLEGHRENVNGVAFTFDNKSVVSVSADPQLSHLAARHGGAPTIVPLAAPLNSVGIARDGEIVAGASDGKVLFFSPAGEQRAELAAAETPVISLALSGDGKLIAAAGVRGSVAIIDRGSRSVLRTLVGPGLPVWAVVFLPDNHTLVTGGSDQMVRRWDVATGDPIGSVPLAGRHDPLAAYAGDRGAEVYRACIACHTLSPEEGNRAGPSLARHIWTEDREPAGLQLLRCTQETRHRLDARDRGQAVRSRTDAVHAGHQDAGAENRIGRRPRGAGRVSENGDAVAGVSFRSCARIRASTVRAREDSPRRCEDLGAAPHGDRSLSRS